MAENTADAATRKPGHNGYDSEALKGFYAEFETQQAEIDKIMAEARKKAEPYREQQKDIKNACKKKTGLSKGTFSHVIKERKLRKKIEEIDEDLRQEEIEDADRVREALGMFADMPLGQAAVDKAPPPKGAAPGSFRDVNAKQEAKEAAAAKAAQ